MALSANQKPGKQKFENDPEACPKMSLLLFLTTADRAGPSSGGNWAFLGFELIFYSFKLN